MPFTRKMKLLGQLAMFCLLAAGTGQAATLTINSGDVAWGTSGTGTARVRYSIATDAYYLNSNTTTAWKSGYVNGTDANTRATRLTDGGGTYIASNTPNSNLTASSVWSFNTTGQTLQSLQIINRTQSYLDGGNPTSVDWSISTDWNGTTGTWTRYLLVASSISLPSPQTDSGNYYDLTSYVQGLDHFAIKVVMHPYWGNAAAQIFRNNYTYGMDVLMVVPEPASLGLLALGGLALFRRRR